MMQRLGMGEYPENGAGDGPPERDKAPAISIEDVADLHAAGPGASTVGAPDTMTGTSIGHYLVGRRLGGGAMAAVYRAHDQLLGQDVAIKVVLPGADSVMQARFRREARLVSTLIHPHIVRTLQVGRSSGVVYIAMELIEGTTLAELLEQHGKLAVADAARILAPIAEALAHAHEKGIVHRDVKPSNILLQRAQPGTEHSVKLGVLPYPVVPLLSDFGIARALDAPELTNAGRTIGTPAFMAPEQCAGSADIDGRADVYALGAVFYRCLVGRAPFSGSTTQILHAHVYDPLLIPDEVAETLPKPVIQVLARAMMKDPAQRFASTRMLAAELQQISSLADESVDAPNGDIVDSTMTMASLPATKTPTTQTSRVLVPAPPVAANATPARLTPIKPVLRPAVPLTTPVRALPTAASRGAERTRRSRWGMFALVGAFSVLVVLAVAMLVNSVWPGGGVDDPAQADATATPAAVAAAGTPQGSLVEPSIEDSRPNGRATAEAGTAQPTRPTAEPTPSGPTPTPQPPIPEIMPRWELAVASYDEGDWQAAIDSLILVSRTVDGWDLPGEEEIDLQRLNEMRVTSYIGLATGAAASGGRERTLQNMEKAAAFMPNESLLAQMVTNAGSLVELLDRNNDNAAQSQRAALLVDYAELQAAYGSRLAIMDRVCDAAIHLSFANKIATTEALVEQQNELDAACLDLNAETAIVQTGGTILYSAVAGNDFNIYRMPISEGVGRYLPSSPVMTAASQPQLSPNGGVLAYHSWQPGNDGLSGIGVSGLSVIGGGTRYGPHPEDSRFSPPSWNSTTSMLVYSTAFNNEPSHVWLTSADTNTNAQKMGIGKDPAWHPRADLIVFNGPDSTGQNTGLQLMSSSQGGADRRTLTTNGNDSRPVWSSDGRYVVFMSKDRQGGSSWEIYRYDMESGEILLLTDGHPAQDGLPAISPDNKWVAFMSDRGEVWNLWYVSINGGEVHFLSSISGQPLSWLEHSVQWVR